MSERYYVQMVRLFAEATVVEVEAASPEEAMIAAIPIAAELGDQRWGSVIDDEEYAPHPLSATLANEVEDPAELMFPSGHRFLALFADTDSGQGQVLLEPWLAQVNSLAVADMAGDWEGDIQDLKQSSAEEYMEHLGGVTPTPGSNVIDFAQAVLRRRFGLPPKTTK